MTAHLTTAALVSVLAVHPAAAQTDPTDPSALYTKSCGACHDGADVRAPDRQALKLRTPDAILASMVGGSMIVQARDLSLAEKRAIAQFLGTPAPREAPPEPALCLPAPLGDVAAGPRWTGWSADLENTRFQQHPGLSADEVPRLKLKWAFGFPGAVVAYAQPAVAAGRLFVGSSSGVVYALNAKTGCAHWSYFAPAAVRTAISIGTVPGVGAPRPAVFFGDLKATVHALDASTGTPLWTRQVERHPAARITGAPALHGDRLYVPISSWEEASGAKEGYECCTFRGSVAVLDTADGRLIWQAYTIPDPPRPTRKTPKGTQLWGPSGAAIWMAPTIDVARRAIYVGTGNAYSEPAGDTSDAILALDMDTGKIRWTRQITPNDVFVMNCREGNTNCPDEVGPDFDFGSSPILRRTPAGRSILVVGQKSGVTYGLDPDKAGAILWQFRAGKGGPLGGIEWGMAADEERVYIPVSDLLEPADAPRGLFALRIATGEQVWHAPAPALTCAGGRGCVGAQSAAITAIPGIVFAGSIDGHMRAYSTRDGRVVWTFDTARDFETVNRVKARGGSIDAAGPVVVDGMLFTNSGYGMWRGKPGNVLLAFEVEK
ncbi:MAG: PQQ-binding-like beta-propeller repeat protein [Vicinamibacterales bacterium]